MSIGPRKYGLLGMVSDVKGKLSVPNSSISGFVFRNLSQSRLLGLKTV